VTERTLVRTIPVGMLQCNCSILVDEETRDALIIDPGDEPDRILEELETLKARPVALLHTHAHFDHIGGTRAVAEATGASIRLHPADLPLYNRLPDQAAYFGLQAKPPRPVDATLSDGEDISFGRLSVRAIHTPGHTPGSTCFSLEGESPVLFSGDTLFRRSIGRTDLWGGSTPTILASIRGKLFNLPPDLRVICGHGPDTTIGEERRSNPFAAL
jgi:glyoxylase-like metal-dependent hydrolase (beta-lactamase superfamily II)